MYPIVHVVERLAVAGAAAVVDRVDGVAVVDQVLDQVVVADARLAARSAVHPDQRRHLVARVRGVRLVEDAGDLDAVV